MKPIIAAVVVLVGGAAGGAALIASGEPPKAADYSEYGCRELQAEITTRWTAGGWDSPAQLDAAVVAGSKNAAKAAAASAEFVRKGCRSG